MDIATRRAAFAEELRFVGHIQSDRVVRAFATVPRERFLGQRPWQVFDLASGGYWPVPGDDPGDAYHNVLFAIDGQRKLNTGHPEFWARLLDALDVRDGDTVYHVGAGVGYYSAIMAELAGPAGSVIAAEIDPSLAAYARGNLAPMENVQVAAADGTVFDPGPVDVIVLSAGATHPMPGWLRGLLPGGRLLIPLTTENWQGTVFRIERLGDTQRYAAAAICGVGIYPCSGARTEEGEALLSRALDGGGQDAVRSLRIDPHERDATCWLHGDGFCLSTQPAV